MVKSGNNIELSINFGLTKPLKSLIYKQYRVLVFNYNSIKSFMVNIYFFITKSLFLDIR